MILEAMKMAMVLPTVVIDGCRPTDQELSSWRADVSQSVRKEMQLLRDLGVSEANGTSNDWPLPLWCLVNLPFITMNFEISSCLISIRDLQLSQQE
jgi:hypothetical protein